MSIIMIYANKLACVTDSLQGRYRLWTLYCDNAISNQLSPSFNLRFQETPFFVHFHSQDQMERNKFGLFPAG